MYLYLLSLALAGGTGSGPGAPESLRELAQVYVHTREAAEYLNTHPEVPIPSFSRQTGLACSACHTAFPALTPFGRLFKLNGYTLTGLQTVGAGATGKRPALKLNLIPPLSVMAQASWTHVRTAEPGTQDGTVQLPQELSLFVGEEITPKMGTFVQVTYDPEAGGIAIDNVDVRFASHAGVATKDLLFGLSLNNNPTVQDVWNTTPAWGFPYASSAVAPTPVATLSEGGLEQSVAGLGAYGLWNNTVYAEASAYRSSPQGAPPLPDSTSVNTLKGVAPYGRLALQHQWGRNYGMVGGWARGQSVPDWRQRSPGSLHGPRAGRAVRAERRRRECYGTCTLDP